MDRLEILVDQVCTQIKEIDPDAAIRVTRDTFEDEDIDVLVYTSSDLIPKMSDETARLAVDILAEEGYHILVLPMTKEALKVEAQRLLEMAS